MRSPMATTVMKRLLIFSKLINLVTQYQNIFKKHHLNYILAISHCKEPIPKILNKYSQKRNCGHSPNFHIHVSVRDWYIPTMDLPSLLLEICGPILEICKSLIDTWMWKLGLWPPFLFWDNINRIVIAVRSDSLTKPPDLIHSKICFFSSRSYETIFTSRREKKYSLWGTSNNHL